MENFTLFCVFCKVKYKVTLLKTKSYSFFCPVKCKVTKSYHGQEQVRLSPPHGPAKRGGFEHRKALQNFTVRYRKLHLRH